MKYILIWWLLSKTDSRYDNFTRAIATHSQEFNSKAKCLIAKSELERQSYSLSQVKAFCVKK